MTRGTVLIVEDEPEVADVLEFNLRADGFETRVAPDGLTACRLVGEQPPDLMLLDLLLPDLQGWEVCRMIRSHGDPAVAGLPIMMLTALATTDDKLRGLELGADDYLTKPFSVREVVLKARHLIGKRRESEAAARRLRDLEKDRRDDRDLQALLFHELKNKLVVIGGFSHRLAAASGQGERSRQYAAVIHQASQYLSALAEQVILLRRVEEGTLGLPVEEVDIDQAVRALAELHRASAAEKNIQLHVDSSTASPMARGNALALRVCLSNLVENAVRYSPSGTEVAVRARRTADQLFLEVDDQGPGIPEEEREQVFERFYRGGTAQGINGTGLGLYVVRILARAMGGNAWVSAGPDGRGTRARLHIPQPYPGSADAGAEAGAGAREPSFGSRRPEGILPAQVADG